MTIPIFISILILKQFKLSGRHWMLLITANLTFFFFLFPHQFPQCSAIKKIIFRLLFPIFAGSSGNYRGKKIPKFQTYLFSIFVSREHSSSALGPVAYSRVAAAVTSHTWECSCSSQHISTLTSKSKNKIHNTYNQYQDVINVSIKILGWSHYIFPHH